MGPLSALTSRAPARCCRTSSIVGVRGRAEGGAPDVAPLNPQRSEPALDVLVAELRVGARPVAAFSAAPGRSMAQSQTLRAVAARARLGADVVAACAA